MAAIADRGKRVLCEQTGACNEETKPWTVTERCKQQVGKEIASIWNGLPDGEKEGYKQRASDAKAEYDQLYPKQPKEVRLHALRTAAGLEADIGHRWHLSRPTSLGPICTIDCGW